MTIDALANSSRAGLKERVATSSQAISRAHAHTMQAIQPRLDQLYRDISATQREVSTEQSGMASLPILARRNIDILKLFVARQVNAFAEAAKLITKQLIHGAASTGTKAAQGLLALALGNQDFTMLPVPDLVGQSKQRLDDLYSDFGVQAGQLVGLALTRGVALGSKAKLIAGEVRQALDTPRWRALAIADTESFKAFNAVQLANYGMNARTVQGWRWHCQLSPHSCACCVALHGSKHGFAETLHDHPNGSCIAVPYVAGMKPGISGADWFDQQSEATQRQILGSNAAYALYQRSGVPLHRFICMHDHPQHGPSVYQCSVKEITSKGKTRGNYA